MIEVSGRLYPVEVRYRPVGGDAEDTTRDEEEQALGDAVEELFREGPGDVLVFLPGEREIREAAEVLAQAPAEGRRDPAALRPPVGGGAGPRIPSAAARAAWCSRPTSPRPRSPCRASATWSTPGRRASSATRYRNKVEMLRVEHISQAAAQQRAGRCGRVADGVCIRLYGEEDFAKRPAFTDPEVLRSSLAAVILRAKSLGIGEIETFPFLDPPSPRAITDGYGLLHELGAVDEEKNLTEIGRELARLPLDPRVARMLVAAREEGCLEQVLVIAAALSVQDPRERPLERAAAADEKHARFADETLRLPRLPQAVEGVRQARWRRPAARTSFPSRACANGATSMRSCARPWKSSSGRFRPCNVEKPGGLPGGSSRIARRLARQRRHAGRSRRQLHRRARHQVLGAPGLVA